MTGFLLLVAIVLFICVALNNASSKFGIPVLLVFIAIGMLFGNNGLFPIKLEDYELVEKLCSTALIFIMFYGGFGTNWKSAKVVVKESALLATLGVIMTALLTGAFCHFILGWGLIESFLIGSVVSSTDAASVFSILRTRKLGLKNHSAPILEIESGSNDPCSYLLTTIMLSVMNGTASGGKLALMFVGQIVIGLVAGFLIAKFAVWGIKKVGISASGFASLFTFAVAILSYALPDLLGGNGYLSAYIVGIIMGNSNFAGKRELVHFFDGITSMMQVLIFFTIGLLAHPAQLEKVLLPSIAIFLAMLLIVRPITIAAILTPFKKYGFKQQALISFAGLRGASSVVFAIVAVVGATALEHDLFNIVFCIVLCSIIIQGCFLPFAAKKLDQIDDNSDVLKTFTDFAEETDMQFTQIAIDSSNPWKGKKVSELGLPRSILLCLVKKHDGKSVIPNGHTVIEEGDRVIFCTLAYRGNSRVRLVEVPVLPNSKADGCAIQDYPFKENEQLVLVKRGEESFIPYGGTKLRAYDTLIINKG